MEASACIIRLCAKEWRERAIDYISLQFMRRYGTSPPRHETPPTLFVAKEDESIVGTLALDFGSEGPLPYERFFSFDPARIPIADYDRERAAYYSRWNSSRPMVGKALWLAASRHAQRKGAIYSASTGKAFIYEYFLREFDCPWHPIPGAIMLPEQIAESDRKYFLTEPRPGPYVGVICRQIRALPDILAEPLHSGRIRMETEEGSPEI